MRQFHIKPYHVWRTAAVLFALLVLSLQILIGLPARYTSSATGGDSARVARFSFSVSSEDTSVDPTYTEGAANTTESSTYLINVTNKDANNNVCEVSLRYWVIVTLTEPLPVGSVDPQDTSYISITLGGQTGTASADGTVFTFEGTETLAAGVEKTVEEELTFTVDFEKMKTAEWFDEMTVDFSADNPACLYGDYHMEGGFTVEVLAEQID